MFVSFLSASPAAPGPLVQDVSVLRACYPDVTFSYSYDSDAEDWVVLINSWQKTNSLYYAGGRFLTKEQASHKADFWLLIYEYSTNIPDPKTFTPEQIERAKIAGSDETRANGSVQGTAFFDSVYDTSSRKDTESHLQKITFFGFPLNVHEKVVPAIKRVEKRITQLAEKDASVASFIKNLKSVYGYQWRTIRDSDGRSFHSMGLAVDIQPKKLNGKTIYWEWEKNKPNPNWMIVPLSRRWMPPESVREAFYSEGFVWGGNWTEWDNMHFEYRPELLAGHNKIFYIK
jgi:hypothetical protein